MAKHIVTNVSPGPRGFWSGDQHILLEAGQSTAEPVEISDGELASAKAAGHFKFGAAAAKAAEQDPLDHDGDGKKGGAAKTS